MLKIFKNKKGIGPVVLASLLGGIPLILIALMVGIPTMITLFTHTEIFYIIAIIFGVFVAWKVFR